MNKAQQFLKDEKDKYGRLFVTLSYAVDKISPFVEDNQKNRRQYYSKLPYLKKYIDLIESAEQEIKRSGFFQRLGENKYIELLKDYKNDNIDCFNQLERCSRCSCLNCAAQCSFGSCLSCREGSNIVSCDHKSINVTRHNNFVLSLTNSKTGGSDSYLVAATMEDIERDMKYIVIENTVSDEKFILRYFPGISEDNYGEITDPAEFDKIVSIYQSLN